MIHKIIKIIFLYCILTLGVFAETTLKLDSNNTQIKQTDNIKVTLTIISDDDIQLEDFAIPGIEKFTVLSHRRTESIQILNEVKNVKIQFDFILQPNMIGDLQIGPIEFGGIQSNILSLGVGVPVPKITQGTQTNITSNIKIQDITPNRNIEFSLKNFGYYPTLIILVFICIISLFVLFIKPKHNRQATDKVSEIDNFAEIKNKLINLKNKSKDLTKNKFYSEFNGIIRSYFSLIGIDSAEEKTLKEMVKENINNEVLEIFSKTYSGEFSSEPENDEYRDNLIDAFKKLLK